MPPTPLALGVSSFTFGWNVALGRMDHLAVVGFARDVGVRVVQFGDNLPVHLLAEGELERLAGAAGGAGLRLELGARGLTAGHLAAYVALCGRLGARVLRMVIDAGDHRPGVGEVVDVVREALPRLVEAGVVLGIENHDRWPARAYREVVQAVGSPAVGVCLDTANSLGAGEGIGEVAAELGAYAVNLHIKDFAIARVPNQMGFTVEGRPAGEGMLDIPGLLRDIARAQSAGPWRCETATLELWTPAVAGGDDAQTAEREREWAVRSVAYLRRLIEL